MKLDRLHGGLADPGLLGTLRLPDALAALQDRILGDIVALVDVLQALQHFKLLRQALVAGLESQGSLFEG